MNQNTNNNTNSCFDRGMAGDNVGILLRGIQRNQIERGMVLAKPGSITPHSVFEAEVYILKKEEGGRHTPFFIGYRPQFYVRTTDVTGTIINFTTDDGSATEMVMPGDRIRMTVELIKPIAIEQGMRFAIREGGRTVGAGIVSKILNGRSAISSKSSYSTPEYKLAESSYIEGELIEYKEPSFSSFLEISIGINGQVQKFFLDSKIRANRNLTPEYLFEIISRLKEAWDTYFKNSEETNYLEPEGEELSNFAKEQLGYDYIKLICTCANFSYRPATRFLDNDSIDATIEDSKARNQIKIQIKTVSRPFYFDKYLKYNLNIKNYNDLRGEENTILVIVVVPQYQPLSLKTVNFDTYWISTSDWQETTNSSGKTIYIPRSQVFDVEPLKAIMQKVSNGERL